MTSAQIIKALQLRRMCGTYATARWLAKQGVPFAWARWVLCVVKP